MKVFLFSVLILLQLSAFMPCAWSQQDQPATERVRRETRGLDGGDVVFEADSIERLFGRTRFVGNVKTTTRPSTPDQLVMVLRADEAEVQMRGLAISPRGNVKVTFEKAGDGSLQ